MIEAKEVRKVKEVIRSDGLWRFACGDVCVCMWMCICIVCVCDSVSCICICICTAIALAGASTSPCVLIIHAIRQSAFSSYLPSHPPSQPPSLYSTRPEVWNYSRLRILKFKTAVCSEFDLSLSHSLISIARIPHLARNTRWRIQHNKVSWAVAAK